MSNATSNTNTNNDKPGENPNAKCIVLVPTAQTIDPGCEEGLQGLEKAGYTVWRKFGCSDISMGRSSMAAEALAKGFDELMWIDSDTLFNPLDVTKLRSHRRPIVGGVCAKKGDGTFACVFSPKYESVTFGVGGGLFQAQFLGTAFLLTHRRVYEKIRVKEKMPKIYNQGRLSTYTSYFGTTFQHNRVGKKVSSTYLSEDYGFCYRARRCGFDVLVDTTIRLGHIGLYVYTWEDILPRPPRLGTLIVNLRQNAPPATKQQTH